LAPTTSGIGLGHDRTSSAGLRRGASGAGAAAIEGAPTVAVVVVSDSAVVAMRDWVVGDVTGGAVDSVEVDDVNDEAEGRASASSARVEVAVLAV